MKDFTRNDYEKVKAQVLREFWASESATTQKRNQFRERSWLYQTVAEDEKVKVNLIRSLTNSLLALYYQDKLQVKWNSRDLYHFIEARNFQSVCEYDYDNLDMEVEDYINQKNKFLKGVWIRVLTWWDDEKKNPTYKVVDPLSWYPDPRGHTHIRNFDYMWFETKMPIDAAKEMQRQGKWRKVDIQPWLTPQQNQQLQDKWNPRYINQHTAVEKDVTIYTHYTMYEWKPIQVIMYKRDAILDMKYVKPILKWDKLIDCNVKFPVALNYWEPHEWDPRGINLYDVVEDKQKLQTLMMNLIRIQAIKQALGGRVFLDRNIYTKSKKILSQWVLWPQYIPVDWNGQNIGNMLFIEPEKWLSPDVYNFQNQLSNQAESDTGISKLTQWVGDPNMTTASEATIAQDNANINKVLGNKINAWWEKTFWQLWYMFYKHYFSIKDEKYVELTRGISPAWDIFTRKNIIWGNDPRIQIINKWDLDSQNRADLDKFVQLYAMIMADQTASPAEKRFMKRKYCALIWMSQSEIEQACAYTPAELDAKEQVILLNNNIPVQIWSMDEDHYTYLTIYQSALNTPATRAAIEMRKMAYIQSWQQQRDMMAMWIGWMPWQTGNQWIMNWVTNNMIQKDNQLKTQPF